MPLAVVDANVGGCRKPLGADTLACESRPTRNENGPKDVRWVVCHGGWKRWWCAGVMPRQQGEKAPLSNHKPPFFWQWRSYPQAGLAAVTQWTCGGRRVNVEQQLSFSPGARRYAAYMPTLQNKGYRGSGCRGEVRLGRRRESRANGMEMGKDPMTR